MSLFILATAPKHQFGGDPVMVPPNPDLDRYEQTERTCRLCQLVKITAFTPQGIKRLWRYPGAREQVALFEAPVCRPVEVVAK